MRSTSKVRRLLMLINFLKSRRYYNATVLADLCNTSRRTVFRDFRVLEQCGVTIHYDSVKLGYWISDPVDSLAPSLTSAQATATILSTHILSRIGTGVPYLSEPETVAYGLAQSLDATRSQHVHELCDFISVHNASQLSQEVQEVLTTISEAYLCRKSVRTTYCTHSADSQICTLLSPYALVLEPLTLSWVVIGRSSRDRLIISLPVSKNMKVERTEYEYAIPPRFSADSYLGNHWGTERVRNSLECVEIRFSKCHYSQVHHVTRGLMQSIEPESDRSFILRLQVKDPDSMLRWILSFGANAEVLSPVSLRLQVEEHAKEILRRSERSTSRSA